MEQSEQSGRTRISYSRDEMLLLKSEPCCLSLPKDIHADNLRDLQESAFFDDSNTRLYLGPQKPSSTAANRHPALFGPGTGRGRGHFGPNPMELGDGKSAPGSSTGNLKILGRSRLVDDGNVSDSLSRKHNPGKSLSTLDGGSQFDRWDSHKQRGSEDDWISIKNRNNQADRDSLDHPEQEPGGSSWRSSGSWGSQQRQRGNPISAGSTRWGSSMDKASGASGTSDDDWRAAKQGGHLRSPRYDWKDHGGALQRESKSETSGLSGGLDISSSKLISQPSESDEQWKKNVNTDSRNDIPEWASIEANIGVVPMTAADIEQERQQMHAQWSKKKTEEKNVGQLPDNLGEPIDLVGDSEIEAWRREQEEEEAKEKAEMEIKAQHQQLRATVQLPQAGEHVDVSSLLGNRMGLSNIDDRDFGNNLVPNQNPSATQQGIQQNQTRIMNNSIQDKMGFSSEAPNGQAAGQALLNMLHTGPNIGPSPVDLDLLHRMSNQERSAQTGQTGSVPGLSNDPDTIRALEGAAGLSHQSILMGAGPPNMMQGGFSPAKAQLPQAAGGQQMFPHAMPPPNLLSIQHNRPPGPQFGSPGQIRQDNRMEILPQQAEQKFPIPNAAPHRPGMPLPVHPSQQGFILPQHHMMVQRPNFPPGSGMPPQGSNPPLNQQQANEQLVRLLSQAGVNLGPRGMPENIPMQGNLPSGQTRPFPPNMSLNPVNMPRPGQSVDIHALLGQDRLGANMMRPSPDLPLGNTQVPRQAMPPFGTSMELDSRLVYPSNAQMPHQATGMMGALPSNSNTSSSELRPANQLPSSSGIPGYNTMHQGPLTDQQQVILQRAIQSSAARQQLRQPQQQLPQQPGSEELSALMEKLGMIKSSK